MIISFIPRTAVLTCHPETPCQAVHGIEARLCWKDTTALGLTFILRGGLSRLRIPPPRTPRRADRLWQHTCFEAFVGVKGKPEYYEFNFAPSGEWAAYSFRNYRDGVPLGDETLKPKIIGRSTRDSLDLNAIVDLNGLAVIASNARLRLGLSAVIEDDEGILSYWALKHRPGKPDFHHPDAFALELTAPDVEPADESTRDK